MRLFFRTALFSGLLLGVLLFQPAVAAAGDIGEVQFPSSIPPLPANSDFPRTNGEGNPIDIPGDVANKGYHVSVIKDDVYWITDGNYHAMAILHRKGVILVDAPQPLPFFGNLPVLAAVAEIAPGEPITHFIYSHAHTDHNGGASAVIDAFPDAKIVAHRETKRILKEVNDPRRPLPTKTFKKKLRLNLGADDDDDDNRDRQRVELHYFGDTHQAGNIFIWLPDQKILMAVDIIYPGWVPFRRLALSSDIPGWLKGHEAVASFDFDVLVPGHLTRLGTRADVELALEYNADIKRYVDEIYWDPNTFLDAVGALFGAGFDAFSTEAKWALFSAFYDTATKNCSDQLTAKWTGVLAGGETFNFSNCEAYFVELRVGNVEAPPPPAP